MTASSQTRVTHVEDHSIMRDLLRDASENTGESQTDVWRCCESNRSCSASVAARALTDPEAPSPRYPEGVAVRRCWTR